MTTTPTDEAIEAVAASQHGRFTRAQVRDCGAEGSWIISSRLRSGRWRRLTRRVLCLPAAPSGWLADIWTARLHVGEDAVVSHRSAARMHAFPGAARSTPCLSVPAGSNRRYPAGRLYQRGDIVPGQVMRIGGLVVTSPARTLVDLAPGASRSRLERWLEHVTAERLATPDELVDVVRLCGRRGKPSLEALEDLLGEYLPGSGSPRGTLERALANVIRIAGLPPGVGQFEDRGAPGREQFCDRAWLQPRLIVECDGRRWHDRVTGARIDERRDASASAEGWRTVRYGYEELVRDPLSAAEELRSIYETRMLGEVSSAV